ncbi:MAG TPA: hypothetical protein V6D22_22795 [Candidatus Obscuribacterales bacterium]
MRLAVASLAMLIVSISAGHAQQSPADQSIPPLRGTLAVPQRHEPTLAELDKTQGQVWHRVTLRLNGSMCPACLLELEGKLQALPGVPFAKTTRPESASAEAAAKTTKKHADVVIIYDKNTVLFERLRDLIKSTDYQISNLIDTEMKP